MSREGLGRALSNRTIFWGAVLLLAVAAGALWLLLALLGAGTETDRVRLEVFRTAGSVVLGTGGAVALLLAARRQRSQELDLLQKERVQAHAEQVALLSQKHQHQVAEDSRFDAAQRRITDLYSKASDQLGSDKAAVRLAGLYSLERLAQGNIDLRQTIVNVICAYLRMPFIASDLNRIDAPFDNRTSEDHNRFQELEVRITAQRILAAHIRPGENQEQIELTFWVNMDLDLTFATLHFFDMNHAHIRSGAFGGATFVGNARFDGTRFDGQAIFGGARFERSAGFRSVIFADAVRFKGARFSGHASFDRASFRAETLFGGTRIQDSENIPDGAHFADGATFIGSNFVQMPIFDHVQTSSALSDLPGQETWHSSTDSAHETWKVIRDNNPSDLL